MIVVLAVMTGQVMMSVILLILVLAHTRHVLVSARPVSIDSGAGPHICLLFAEKGTDPTAKMLLSR